MTFLETAFLVLAVCGTGVFALTLAYCSVKQENN